MKNVLCRPRSLSGLRTRPLSTAALFGVLFVSAISGIAHADESDCGDLRNAYGPFDYRTVPEMNRFLVEKEHFTPEVERLIKGNAGYIGADLDYTLRAMPNHHRALLSMTNLSFKEGTERPRGSRYTVACWFDRAIRLAPDDGKMRSVYGYYLSRKGRSKEAIEQFKLALEYGQDDGNTHYNLGLVLFNVKEYDESLAHAKAAEERGFPLQGLKNKLQSINKWVE